GVCFDELSQDDSLSLIEINSALSSVSAEMTDKFEFIGFDACLMATLETANILVPYARYMYASEETMSGSGWDYVDFLNFLVKNTYTDGAKIGKALCGRMYDYYIDENLNDGMTFSVTDLSMIDDLLTLFNETAQEIYDGGYMNEIAREIYKADNFGGNNKSEGYFNMVDLLGLLNAASEYCLTAEDTIEALNNAVIEKTSGSVHKNAGGLSLYYPLSANSAEELAEFAGICTSTYYLAFTDLMAYGATGEDVYDYDNSWINEDIDNLRNISYSFSGEIEQEEVSPLDEDSLIEISEIYFDEDGTYTVQLYSTDYFSYATCGLFTLTEDGEMYSFGEDDEVYTDLDDMLLQDCFDGSWPSIGDVPICIHIVSKNDEKSVYTCPIKLNDTVTNLRFEYDFTEEKWNVLGAWDGVDAASGMASREIIEIKDGDTITLLYSNVSSGENTFYSGESFTVDGELTIEYKPLPAGEYNYAMNLYDVYGKQYSTDFVTFTCDENGEVYYDPGELDNLQEEEEDTDETDDESSDEADTVSDEE
ncbi:MAG: clostripain-related cysteine peptidase, partial [Ruminiclostridium sp.]